MKRTATIAALLLAVLAAAATALAAVQVYSNGFAKRADSKELRLEGKGCKRDWDREQERLDLLAKGGPARCKVKLPVQGDAAQPDHELELTAKVDKSTPGSVRKQVYVAVSIREGKNSRYELRVYPHRQRYELSREPDDDQFPIRGRDKGIGRVGERNSLRIKAIGDRIQGSVNKQKVGPVEDPAAGDQKGTRMSLTLGVEERTGEPVRAWLDDVKVRIPEP